MINDKQKLWVNIFVSILTGISFLIFVGLSIYYIIIKNYVLFGIYVVSSVILLVCTLIFLIRVYKLTHKK